MTEVENDWEVEVETIDLGPIKVEKRLDRGRRLEVEKDLKIEVETFDLTPVEVEIQIEFQNPSTKISLCWTRCGAVIISAQNDGVRRILFGLLCASCAFVI
ncbi:hypothetical protein POM88_004042 [Heracleum sosnowskyi]|uniref:Uncharacterized protein n=1 Tax=Heracleum sosnowskyi TaxID=360622 RepID=A0AAD8JH97_9APIA|nr:hypothetical protein POM88_004042 [Heracleum sosnowskyi]